MVPNQLRNQGIRLNAASLDRQLALRGLTARQLAHISGVSETAISQARNGRRRINERTLRKLAPFPRHLSPFADWAARREA